MRTLCCPIFNCGVQIGRFDSFADAGRPMQEHLWTHDWVCVVDELGQDFLDRWKLSGP